MDNYEIASVLKYTASLLELHDENVFKVKALQSAVIAIENLSTPLHTLSLEQLNKINGLGKSIAAKVHEIITTNTLEELDALLSVTPGGVIDMLQIKGIGPKKVRALWKDLGVETTEDLLAACNEKKVRAIKGFGEKTEESIRQFLLYNAANKGKMLFAEAEIWATQILEKIKEATGISQISLTGAVRRKSEIVEKIQIVAGVDDPILFFNKLSGLTYLEKDRKNSAPFAWRGTWKDPGINLEIKLYKKEKYASQVYIHSSSLEHLTKEISTGKTILKQAYKTQPDSEETLLQELGLTFVPPECREGSWEFEAAQSDGFSQLISTGELKGILHNHSTYSDGVHTLEQMALKCKESGYQYLGICDHSKSGNFYNGGMYENKVKEQHQEIDRLNEKLAPFKIFKGIESDILNDGSLDYENDVLASFDFIVASIHSNLKMDEEKATSRLLKAIENPYTTMLGHPSGRILLRREGYPLNYKKIIDACAANSVIIEINADPNRLDLDWRYVRYAMEKGVLISINPDAHSMEAYDNMKYGVNVARKAGLTKAMTFNAFSLEKVESHFLKRKKLFN